MPTSFRDSINQVSDTVLKRTFVDGLDSIIIDEMLRNLPEEQLIVLRARVKSYLCNRLLIREIIAI